MAVTVTLPFVRLVRTRPGARQLKVRVEREVSLPELASSSMPVAYVAPNGDRYLERVGRLYASLGVTRTLDGLRDACERRVRLGTGNRGGEVRMPDEQGLFEDGLAMLEREVREVEDDYAIIDGGMAARVAVPAVGVAIMEGRLVRVLTHRGREAGVLAGPSEAPWLAYPVSMAGEARAAAARLAKTAVEAGLAWGSMGVKDTFGAWEVRDAEAVARVEDRHVNGPEAWPAAMLSLSDRALPSDPSDRVRRANARLVLAMGEPGAAWRSMVDLAGAVVAAGPGNVIGAAAAHAGALSLLDRLAAEGRA